MSVCVGLACGCVSLFVLGFCWYVCLSFSPDTSRVVAVPGGGGWLPEPGEGV